MGRVEEIGYVSVPFRLPASSTMGKSSSISYSSPYCHSKRRRTYSLPRGIDSSSASSSAYASRSKSSISSPIGIVRPIRQTRVGVREDPRVRGLAGHHAPPEDDGVVHLLVHLLLGDAPVLLIRDVVRRPRGEPVGGGASSAGGTRREPCSSPCAGAVGEYDEVRADRVAGGEFDDVSGSSLSGETAGRCRRRGPTRPRGTRRRRLQRGRGASRRSGRGGRCSRTCRTRSRFRCL